jgi:hypothetical protein
VKRAPLHDALRRPLVAGVAVVSGAGLVIELVSSRWSTDAVDALVGLLSLSLEQNLPTWYAASLLLGCGLLLVAIARDARAHRRRWALLSAGFFAMSLDETAELHEQLGGLVGGSGVLYFDWVVPAAAVVAVIGVAYLPLLGDLSPRRRRQFVIAGAIYLGGAIGCELPLGWWTERAGDDNLTYALIDWVEETLELVGASLFLLSLAEHRGDAAAASGGGR